MVKSLAALFAFAMALAGCGSGGPPPSQTAELQRQADIRAIEQLEVAFHKAGSTKDVDLMMSIWADNATFTTGGQTLTGKDAIRDFFVTKAGPFQPQNNWISETPAWKIRVTVDGDQGTLYFECHYIDIETKTVASVVGADQKVAKIDGTWLITTLTASSLPELAP